MVDTDFVERRLVSGVSLEGLSEGDEVLYTTEGRTNTETVTSIDENYLLTVCRINSRAIEIRTRTIRDNILNKSYPNPLIVLNCENDDPLQRKFYEVADEYLRGLGR